MQIAPVSVAIIGASLPIIAKVGHEGTVSEWLMD